jgi:hypothetical protein
MASLEFDATQVAVWTQGAFNFPLGDYPFAITAAEVKAVKNKPNSGLLELILTITDGQYAGMTHKTNFNLYNENETSRRIAQQQFSSLCHVIGRLHIQDTQQLIGGRGIVTLGPQDGSDKYCEVKTWKDSQSRVNGTGDPVPPPGGGVTAPTTEAAPWSGATAPFQATSFPPAAAFVSQPAAQQAAPAVQQTPWATPQQPQSGPSAPFAAPSVATSSIPQLATAAPVTAQVPAPAESMRAPITGAVPPWAMPRQ